MTILKRLVRIHGDLGDHNKALECLGEALRIQKEAAVPAAAQSTDLSPAVGPRDETLTRKLKRTRKNIQFYEKHLAISRVSGDQPRVIERLQNISFMYSELGLHRDAEGRMREALDIAWESRDWMAQGCMLDSIGQLYFRWGWLADAVRWFRRSLSVRKMINDEKGVESTETLIGLVYFKMGRYEDALAVRSGKGAVTSGSTPWPGKEVAPGNRARIFNEMGMHREALDIALDTASETDLILHAEIYQAIGEPDKALRFYEREIAARRKYKIPCEDLFDSIGRIYLSQQKTEEAERFLSLSSPFVTHGRISLGRLALAKRDYHQALDLFEKEVAGVSRNRHVGRVFAGHVGLGLSYEALEQSDKAEYHFRKAVDKVEEMRERISPSRRRGFFHHHMFGIPRIAPYEGLCRVLLLNGKHLEALEIAETTKARSFLEVLSSVPPSHYPKISKSALEVDTVINRELAQALEDRWTDLENANTGIASSVEARVQALRKKRELHVASLRKKYPLFAATRYPQPMALQQMALESDEWVIEYEVTDKGIAIFICHGKKLVEAVFRPIKRDQIDALVRKFRESFEFDPHKESLRAMLARFDFTSSRRLSRILLHETLQVLPKGLPVTIIPDDSLGMLPFEALITNLGGRINYEGDLPNIRGADFFGDRNPISYRQSLTALTLARTLGKVNKPSDRLLVIADPVFEQAPEDGRKTAAVSQKDAEKFSTLLSALRRSESGCSDFDRLPYTGLLAEALSVLYEPMVDTYVRFEASKKNLLNNIAPEFHKYGAIVFATHGCLSGGIPFFQEPILVLTTVPEGTDGFLRSSEVIGLDLNADIVALTACESGLGRFLSGEGVMGMGRAFQHAGARSVLMSLWKVEVDSSVSLVRVFFERIKGGMSKLTALRHARNEIRTKGYDHPFFWAAFILAGEPE